MKKFTENNSVQEYSGGLDLDEMVEHGRQLHSAAIGDMLMRLIRLISGQGVKETDQHHGVPHAVGTHSR